jgi:1,4-dihydroxy-2-naphthoyl-CoA hydrolase
MALFADVSLDFVNGLNRNTMSEQIGIEITEIGEDFLRGRMPVDNRTVQPFGILHGGASAALAETLGSIAGTLTLDQDKAYCVGMEINANHIRSIKSGFVYGTARPIHRGKTTQVWEIRIEDEKQRLVCISRLTLAVLRKQF